MYNILYYDSNQFDTEEIKDILNTLKQSLPYDMANKTVTLSKGVELVGYYEEKDLFMKGIS